VVLDLKGNLAFLDSAEFAELRELLQGLKLMPIGVQNASPVQQRAALAAGLGCFAGSSATRRPAERVAPPREEAPRRAPARRPRAPRW